VWLKTRRLVGTLQREQLADEQTIQFIERRSATVDDFRRMFDKAGKAEAQKFSDVVLNVGQNLEAALRDALASKKLRSEEKEECPAKYRGLVNSYFEALSKAAGGRQ